MWAYEVPFYQIYTLGFCGAPLHHSETQNDAPPVPRIRKVLEWIPHLKEIGCGAVYFCPLFSSDSHGYDTRDYRMLDERLGTNADFAEVCRALHEAGIRVVLDAVFNHVGRNFWAFKSVREKNSRYANWFYLNNDGNSNGNNEYNDGFTYECWEGHSSLVRLNHTNEELVEYLFETIAFWIREFGIDGIRLDVAYCLPEDFLRRLSCFCAELPPFADGQKRDFFLLGEMIHGDYNRLLSTGLHSVTNYQAYKGLWSCLNDMNMFEIAYTLDEHFSEKYAGRHLLNFVDNHDVNRAASTLTNPAHLPLLYALMFGIPGIPCIYYGSEWGADGKRGYNCDGDLRPFFDAPQMTELSRFIAQLSAIFKTHCALQYGEYKKIFLSNRQFIFCRSLQDQNERIYVALNADSSPFFAPFDIGTDKAQDLLSGETHFFHGGYELPPCSVFYWKAL